MNDYPPNWQEIAQAVKDAAGWRCVRCGHVHEVSTGYVLTVHHLDRNPANVQPWNLAALCQRCHLYIQAVYVVGTNIEMFLIVEPWLAPYEAGRLGAGGQDGY